MPSMDVRRKRPVYIEMTRRSGSPQPGAQSGAQARNAGGVGGAGGANGAGAGKAGGGGFPLGDVGPNENYALEELLQSGDNANADAAFRVPGQSTGLRNSDPQKSEDPAGRRLGERAKQDEYDVKIWSRHKLYDDEHIEQMKRREAEEAERRAKAMAMDPNAKADMRHALSSLAQTLHTAKMDAAGIGANAVSMTGSSMLG